MQMTETEGKYLKLARRAREEDNTEDAKRYYDLVRTENPDNNEGRFFFAYYKVWDGMKKDWPSNCMDVYRLIPPIIRDISQSDSTEEEKEELLLDIYKSVRILPTECNSVIKDLSSQDFSRITTYGKAGILMFYEFGDSLESYCFNLSNSEAFMKLAVQAWKDGIELQRTWTFYMVDKTFPEKYAAKIQQFEPSYVLPAKNTATGCMSMVRFGK